MARAQHPGRTKAERAAIDDMGAGHTPRIHPDVLDRMLDAGIIVEISPEAKHGPGGTLIVRQFELSSWAHLAWCDWCSG